MLHCKVKKIVIECVWHEEVYKNKITKNRSKKLQQLILETIDQCRQHNMNKAHIALPIYNTFGEIIKKQFAFEENSGYLLLLPWLERSFDASQYSELMRHSGE